MENATTDSWDGIVKNYLKSDNLENKEGSFVCEDIKVIPVKDDDGNSKAKLEIYTTVNDTDYIFSPNWTNTKFIKSQIKAPKNLLGKRLYYEKIKVRNPTTNTMVDGISIIKIE